jgi:hypothetical protein
MGYYDEPETSEVTVSFTCSNDECNHENSEIEVAFFGSFISTENIDVECEKCHLDTQVFIGDESCHCGDRCVC